MSVIDVAITVDRERTGDKSILSAVESAGFTVDRIFPSLRAIYGHGPAEGMEMVKAIDGVAEVREAGTFQLPPTNGSIPQ